MDNNIVIYQAVDGTTAIDVKFESETIWPTQKQIAELFGVKRPAVTRHLKNIFASGELEEKSTCSILEHMGNDEKQRYYTTFYNLDAILSVGYRVNSKNATQFRIWANKVLKEYLLNGYSIKENIKLQQFEELKNTIKILSVILDKRELEQCEATGMLQVVADYTYALDTLDRYDYQKLELTNTTNREQERGDGNNGKGCCKSY